MRHTFELATHHALAEMPTTSGGDVFEVPEFVNILPMPDADDRIESRDYRTLVVDSMEKLVKRSNAARPEDATPAATTTRHSGRSPRRAARSPVRLCASEKTASADKVLVF